MNGLLSLRWNNHSTALLRKLDNLLAKDSYADATISCHGKYFPVHRLVLSTCSEYFEEIFEKTKCKHPFIIVQDIDATILEALLSYMYKGEVNVLQDVLPKLIKAAESLKIKGLAVPDDPIEDEAMQINDKKRGVSISSPVPSRKKVKRTKECNKSKNEDILVEQNKTSLIDSHNSLSTRPNNNEVQYVRNIKKETHDQSDNLIEEVQGLNTTVKSTDVDSDTSPHNHKTPTPELSQNVDKLNLPFDAPVHSPHISGMDHGGRAIRTDEQQRISVAPLKSLQESEVSKDIYQRERPNLYKCKWQHCVFVALTEMEYNAHTMTKHSGDKPHSCSFCDFQTESSHDLRIHLYKHVGGSGLSCQLCTYNADCYSNLEKHIRVHTKEKPYHCPHCPYKTAQSSNLYKHIDSKHKQ